MRRSIRWSLPLLGLLLSLVPSLSAQGRRGLVELPAEPMRHGFWLAGGFGRGSESYRFANDPYTESVDKPVFAFRMGGTPDQHLRLGGEVTTWVNPTTDLDGYNVTETLSSLTLVGQFYPLETAGLFIKGGAGVGVSATSLEYSNTITETGFVVQYGVGYDIRLGSSLALTPTVEMFRHRFTQRDEPDLDERLFHIGVALTWQKRR